MNTTTTIPRMYADNILVKLDLHEPVERRTAAGIIIPDAERAESAIAAVYATVVAVGPGHREDPGSVDVCGELAPGDRVVVESKNHGDRWYDAEKREHRIIRAKDVMGVAEE